MSWTEVQALGVKAASGAGVPPAQSLAFGSMLARHIADGSDQQCIRVALNDPDSILALAHRVERLIEHASISQPVVEVSEPDDCKRAMMRSWLAALPCKTEIKVSTSVITVRLSLSEPSVLVRPDRLELVDTLVQRLSELAEKTYVPDSAASRASGAGAGLMELD